MKQLNNLPPSDIDDDDDYDYDSLARDPFQERWHHRVIGSAYWLFDAVRFWFSWPFVSLAHLLGFSFATLGFKLGRIADRFRRFWYKFMDAAIEFLQIEGMRRSMHDLQHRAARSVDEIRHTVEDSTVRSSWWRGLLDRINERRVKLTVAWYDFLDRFTHSPILNVLTSPLRWSTRFFFAITDFATGWLFTRDYRLLLFGIPAMLMMLPLGYCAVRLPFHNNATKIKHYRRAADTALSNEDYESADLYFRKLRQLGGEHDQMVFRAALAANEQGDVETAYREMLRIAPDGEPGYVDAHVWIALALSEQRVTLPPGTNSTELIEAHLRHAISLSPEPSSLRFWLAEVLTAEGKNQAALETLNEVELRELDWSTRAVAADLYLKLGNPTEARDVALQVARHYQDLYASSTSDDDGLAPRDFLSWAASVEMAGDLGQAIDILAKGLEQHESDTALRETASAIGLTFYDQIEPQTAEQLDHKLRTLNLLYKVCTDLTPVLDRAVRLYSLPGARQTVAGILKDYRQKHGSYPPTILRLLGDLSYTKGKPESALKYYAAAVKADPKLHPAANNLAVLYSTIAPKQLDLALRLANSAIAEAPDNPHYVETRGQIYLQLERWQAAITDLHRALNGMPDSRKIHASLAKAYAATGQAEAAKMHEQRAQR